MPKRGGRVRNWKPNEHYAYSNNDDNTSLSKHDDRAHSNNTRRVSFKPGTNKGKNKFRSWNDASQLLIDGDIDMGASGAQGPNRKGFRGRGGRLGSPAPRPAMPRKKFMPGLLPWYQIIIPYGAKHDKQVILQALLSYISPEIFIPHYYKTNGNTAVFYVDDVKTAEQLFYADRKIVMSDGFKLVVIVRNNVPSVAVDANMKEKMKLAMAKRYNATTKALDLTKFHADPELVDIFCALFRPIIMLAAIDIIAENIPDLEALNLNDNKLHGIDHLKVLCTKLKNLKILYLGDNRINFLGVLDVLRPLQLVELYLKGNPLVKKFNDHDLYVRVPDCFTSFALFMSSEVRRKFPKLVRLDGVDLPPAIGFDVSEDVSLPPSVQSFLVDSAGQNLVREFLTQYFAIYDSDSRQPLLEAYHETATMSMAASYLVNDNRNSPATKLNSYISNSRNLLRITERDSRRRYLRTGKLQVVSFLSDLPKTKHDLMGFAVDLLIFTPAMIVLTMNGVYKEIMVTNTPTRSFHRTFVIVPNSAGGFSITNDMLFVTNTTKDQEAKSFSSSTDAPTPGPAPTPAPVPQYDDNQRAMLAMLSQQTGMNDHWTVNCLQETQWDYQRALFIFNQLQSEGKIPAEAFVK